MIKFPIINNLYMNLFKHVDFSQASMVGHLCRALGDEVSPPQQQENIGNWIASCMPSTCYQGDQSGVDSWLETNIKKTRLGIPPKLHIVHKYMLWDLWAQLFKPPFLSVAIFHICSSLRRVVKWPTGSFNQPILGLPNCPKFIFDSSTKTSNQSPCQKNAGKNQVICRFVEDFPLFFWGGFSRVETNSKTDSKTLDLRVCTMKYLYLFLILQQSECNCGNHVACRTWWIIVWSINICISMYVCINLIQII